MKSRFTLIELLVAVAIIGILASILMPSLQNAKEKAHIAVCLSNSRQLAVAVTIYCDDHSGRFPATSGPGYSGHNWGWAGNSDFWGGNKVTDRPLNPYLSSGIHANSKLTVLRCPSDGSPWHKAPDGGKYSWYRMYGTSYSVNKAPHRDSLGNSNGPQNLHSVREPSKMLMTYENDAIIALVINAFWQARDGSIDPATENGWAVIDMHKKAKAVYSNVTTTDGAAKQMVEIQYRRWDYDTYKFGERHR